MKKNQNTNRGITLIALVITIIVLLILAGVALSMLTGDSGILSNAENAKEQTNLANSKEQVALAVTGALTEGLGTITRDNLEKELNNIVGTGKYNLSTGEGPWTVTVDNYETTIYPNGKIEETEPIDWEQIKADLPTNYSQYLTLAQEKGQVTETNIGIGTDGEVVNLDLWHYYDTDDGKGKSLGKKLVCEGNRGYDEEDLDDNKVQGKMPQYIYIKSEDKVYPVTMLQYTFAYSSVQEIPEIPSTVTSIGDSAFMNCTGLTSVTIPSSVTTIGFSAFYQCTGLTNVTIPSGVMSIGETAFCGCKGLTSVIVNENNTKYDSRNNCNAIIETETNTLIRGCKNTTIPDGVTRIEANAFNSCTGLTSVTIPSSVTSIEPAAFNGCTGLITVIIDSETIASSITARNSGEMLVYNATTIYINEDIEETSIGSYIKEAFQKVTPSGKENYVKYTKK